MRTTSPSPTRGPASTLGPASPLGRPRPARETVRAIRAHARSVLDRRAARALLGVGGAFVALTAVVASGWSAEVDRTVSAWFAQGDRPGAVHTVVRTAVMGGQFWLMGSLVGAVALGRSVLDRSWRPVVVTGTALVTLTVLVSALKRLLGRTSPGSGLNEVFSVGTSYPSGHTATATLGMLLLVVLLRPRGQQRLSRAWLTAASAGAVVVGLTTIVLGYHWVGDVLAGWLVGLLVLVPAARLLLMTGARRDGDGDLA